MIHEGHRRPLVMVLSKAVWGMARSKLNVAGVAEETSNGGYRLDEQVGFLGAAMPGAEVQPAQAAFLDHLRLLFAQRAQ